MSSRGKHNGNEKKMSNRKELRDARRHAAEELRDARRRTAEAARLLGQIESLPRRKGERVAWKNGVIWTRAGDDDWRPMVRPDWHYSSAHVASFDWVRVDAQ